MRRVGTSSPSSRRGRSTAPSWRSPRPRRRWPWRPTGYGSARGCGRCPRATGSLRWRRPTRSTWPSAARRWCSPFLAAANAGRSTPSTRTFPWKTCGRGPRWRCKGAASGRWRGCPPPGPTRGPGPRSSPCTSSRSSGGTKASPHGSRRAPGATAPTGPTWPRTRPCWTTGTSPPGAATCCGGATARNSSGARGRGPGATAGRRPRDAPTRRPPAGWSRRCCATRRCIRARRPFSPSRRTASRPPAIPSPRCACAPWRGRPRRSFRSSGPTGSSGPWPPWCSPTWPWSWCWACATCPRSAAASPTGAGSGAAGCATRSAVSATCSSRTPAGASACWRRCSSSPRWRSCGFGAACAVSRPKRRGRRSTAPPWWARASRPGPPVRSGRRCAPTPGFPAVLRIRAHSRGRRRSPSSRRCATDSPGTLRRCSRRTVPRPSTRRYGRPWAWGKTPGRRPTARPGWSAWARPAPATSAGPT